jgi:hypothetical protein
VLHHGVIIRTVTDNTEDSDSNKTANALQECYRRGWLHSDETPDGNVGYVFASPLHRLFVEWRLAESRNPPKLIASSLLQFTLQVIRQFSPRQLSTPRTIGPDWIQRPSEATYQDEFHRCCHVVSDGSIVTFPEFGNAKGRIDFYIPHMKWGIEILRDGQQLSQHSGRFSDLGSYKGEVPTNDYIILDFRSNYPQAKHPGTQFSSFTIKLKSKLTRLQESVSRCLRYDVSRRPSCG